MKVGATPRDVIYREDKLKVLRVSIAHRKETSHTALDGVPR